MLDIKFVRENPEAVKENIRKKFQNAKLPLVDEAIALDAERRQAIADGEALKAERNKLSKANGPLFGKLKKCTDEAEKAAIQAEIDANNAAVKADAERMAQLEAKKEQAEAALNKIMLVIPQMIDPSVPIGPDDSCNVEVQRFGEPKTPDFEVPYHTDIMERFDGIDMDAAGRVSGSGFYYLLGDIARLHEAVLAYARDFMIGKGFTYCIPPFMIHGNVVEGVMSQTDMDAMMYKIEGEDLYLIGTSEHSMIGKFIDQIIPEDKLPQTLTSYSPCFRKEKGAHGIEERGIYRIHQFEKQEMIVICKPEESKMWFDKLWQDENFREHVCERYGQLRKTTLSDEHIADKIASYQEKLGDAVDRNFKVWGYSFNEALLAGTSKEGTSRDIGSYEEAMEQLTDTIRERLEYLDKELGENRE